MSVFPLTKIPKWGYHKGSGKRWFGASRSDGRKHAACDLIATPGTPVMAVDHGTVLYRAGFYLGTDELVIDHGHFIARYGEVSPEKVVKDMKRGTVVKPGDVIAYVGKLKMLHFEMYQGTEEGALTQKWNKETYKYIAPDKFQRRPDLMDPTPFLDRWKLWTNFSNWVDDVIEEIF